MQITAIPYEYVDDIWPVVVPFLQPACDVQGLFRAQDVKAMLDERVLALWAIFPDDSNKPIAACTTRIVSYPEREGLAIDWLGGSRMKDWLPQLSETLDRYAKDCGCKHIEGMGREGWVRALAPHGYKTWYPMYRKELSDE